MCRLGWSSEERGQFLVHDGSVIVPAAVSGRFRYDADSDPLAFPAVGDWVAIAPAGDETAAPRSTPCCLAGLQLFGALPRTTRRGPQTIAANVDVVFIVTSLNAELNLRRLERYLAVAWESGATPVVVLSKSDLDADIPGHRTAVESVAIGVEVISTSAVSGTGIDGVRAHLGPGRTVAFIGSSGVGKSTLVNALAGHELLATSGIREDDGRGHHTTTRRQLVPLAEGLVIDTPGMRELGLLDGDGLASAFDDIETIAMSCRFNDCRHESEPGCAVGQALASGVLDVARFAAFRKLEREARRAELSTNAVARKAERRKWTAMTRGVGERMDAKYGRER